MLTLINRASHWPEAPLIPMMEQASGYYGEWQPDAQDSILVPDNLGPQRRLMRPIFCLFMGRRGMGKSAAATAVAYEQDRRFLKFNTGQQVVSNYWVSFAARSSPYLVDELMEFPAWAYRLYVAIDEIGSSFPGRRSLAGVNVMFSQFLGQIRKRAIEGSCTTRFPQVLDQQLLMELDLFILCEQFRFTDSKGKLRQAIELRIWDYWGQWTGKMFRKYWPPYAGPMGVYSCDWMKILYPTDIIWSKYKTDEVIAPIWSKARDRIISQQWQVPSTNEVPAGQVKGEREEPAEPKTLEECMALFPDHAFPFSLDNKLTLAKTYDPSIRHMNDFRAWLEAHGYKVKGTTVFQKEK